MLNFEIDKTPPTKKKSILAALEVDHEGDLILSLDGVPVLWVDGDDGDLATFRMTPEQAEEIGVKFDQKTHGIYLWRAGDDE